MISFLQNYDSIILYYLINVLFFFVYIVLALVFFKDITLETAMINITKKQLFDFNVHFYTDNKPTLGTYLCTV